MTANTTKYSHFDDATTQLLHAQTVIQEEMGDLLEKDAVFLTIALPYLDPQDAGVIREAAKERKSRKQRSDVKKQTKFSADDTVMTSAPGTAEQGASPPSVSGTRADGSPHSPPSTAPPSPTPDADVTAPSSTSRKRRQQDGGGKEPGGGNRPQEVKKTHLEEHPEVRLLCGSTAEVYMEWIGQLQQHRATSSHAFKGSTDQERLDNFKRACIRLDHPGLPPVAQG